MSRRRKPLFKKGPERSEAILLTKEIIDLKERLGISKANFCKELNANPQFYDDLKSRWYNERGKASRMYPSHANKLVQFWNAHLVARKVKNPETPSEKSAPATKPEKKSKTRDETMFMVEVLVKKVGFEGAKALLVKKGKLEKYNKYIMTLSPEEIAELV